MAANFCTIKNCNMIPSENNYSLHLRHKDHEDHNEYWLVVFDNVHILSICPKNGTKREYITMNAIAALRNFALMTSQVERWEVYDEQEDWHQYVDNIKTDEI